MIAAYLRVSTQEQAIHGVSLDAQEARLKAVHGADVLVFRDEGVSAGKPLATRPDGALLIQAIERGQVQKVVVASLSRIFRSASECLATVERWEKMGVAFVCLDLGVDTSTAIGKAFLTVASAFSELERNVIRERTRHAMQHLKREGKVLGRPDRWAGAQRSEAMAVAQALQAEGLTLDGVAQAMNALEDGPKPVRGQASWNRASVWRLLKSEGRT